MVPLSLVASLFCAPAVAQYSCIDGGGGNYDCTQPTAEPTPQPTTAPTGLEFFSNFPFFVHAHPAVHNIECRELNNVPENERPELLEIILGSLHTLLERFQMKGANKAEVTEYINDVYKKNSCTWLLWEAHCNPIIITQGYELVRPFGNERFCNDLVEDAINFGLSEADCHAGCLSNTDCIGGYMEDDPTTTEPICHNWIQTEPWSARCFHFFRANTEPVHSSGQFVKHDPVSLEFKTSFNKFHIDVGHTTPIEVYDPPPEDCLSSWSGAGLSLETIVVTSVRISNGDGTFDDSCHYIIDDGTIPLPVPVSCLESIEEVNCLTQRVTPLLEE